MAEAGIGAHEHEEVGEAGNGATLVGFGTAFPCIQQVLAATAMYHACGYRVLGLEAGAINDAVHFPLMAVVIHDHIATHFADAVGQHVDVILGQRRVIVV